MKTYQAETSTREMDAAGHITPQFTGKHVHFVGIGGCGMSGLARLMLQSGARCTGSDMQPSEVIDSLTADGFDVSLRQSADSVPADCQAMVVTAAIRHDHPEIAEARRRGIEVIKYSQALGQLMIGRVGVAVAGTHGKSTTASMLCHALIHAGLDPSFIIGASCAQIGGGSRCGGSPTLVAEACEFDRSFHNLHPTHAAILNVEEDHMDIYGTIDAIVQAFAQFAQRLPEEGSLLINHEMPHRLSITGGLDATVQTIGFAPQADWQVQVDDTAQGAVAPPPEDPTRAVIRLHHRGMQVAQWPAALPGEHMAYNAATAAVMAHRLGASWEQVEQAMAGFRGLDRRMQWLGIKRVPRIETFPRQGVKAPGRVTVIDDYGHHPTEIDTTLRALKRHHRPQRLICVFQPHQHSRTRFLMQQFAASFAQADIVIVPQIYFVRDSEQERHTVSAADLVDRLRQRGKQAMHIYPFDAIVEQLETIARDGDLVVTMGAGDVWRVARSFLRLPEAS